MKRLLRRLMGDDRGGAIAEFMLGLVPLVIALALIFEFGRAFWSHQAVIKGVRDATRYLTRVEDPSDPAAQGVAQRLMLTGQQAEGGTPRWSSGGKPAMEVEVYADETCEKEEVPVGTFRGPTTMLKVAANVELALPLGDVCALFGGDGLGTITYSVGDCARHYGE